MNEVEKWLESKYKENNLKYITNYQLFKYLDEFYVLLKNNYLNKLCELTLPPAVQVAFKKEHLPPEFIESQDFVKRYFFPNSTLITFLRHHSTPEIAVYLKEEGRNSGNWYVHPLKLIEKGLASKGSTRLINNFRRAKSVYDHLNSLKDAQ